MKATLNLLITTIFMTLILLYHQNANAEHRMGSQFWNLNFVRAPFSKTLPWELYLELQPRFDFDQNVRSRVLIRPAIIYQMDTSQTLWLGALDLTDINLEAQEWRSWQQYQRVDRISESVLLNRTRLEQRFKGGENDVGWRLRHMLRVQLPFFAQNNWWWLFFDELFIGINQNKSQTSHGFDQNRALAGVRYDISPNAFVEGGYLHQLTRSESNHNIFLSFGTTLAPLFNEDR